PDAAPTQLCPLSLHDALPISTLGGIAHALDIVGQELENGGRVAAGAGGLAVGDADLTLRHRQARQAIAHEQDMVAAAAEGIGNRDRKSTRLNSSHLVISYAVF